VNKRQVHSPINIITACNALHVQHPKCEREWRALHKLCVARIVEARRRGDEEREKVLTQYKRAIFKATLGQCIVCGRTVTRRCVRCRQHDTVHRYHNKELA
jgi:predicted RNA-binding Zn-ribbon protein involved in translation (DUF1610 family)